MKKEVISNILLSGLIFFTLFFSETYLGNIITPSYYFALFFFSTIYLIQSIVLSKVNNNPKKFVIVYNFVTTFKMLFSVFFLVLYFLVLSKAEPIKSEILFTCFFVVLYFLYLIISLTRLFKK